MHAWICWAVKHLYENKSSTILPGAIGMFIKRFKLFDFYEMRMKSENNSRDEI